MLDRDGFRPNVGIILLNGRNQVFWGKRLKTHSWQFPQGGIKHGETPEQAMFRELHEEVGLRPDHVQIIARTRDWLRYDGVDLGPAGALSVGFRVASAGTGGTGTVELRGMIGENTPASFCWPADAMTSTPSVNACRLPKLISTARDVLAAAERQTRPTPRRRCPCRRADLSFHRRHHGARQVCAVHHRYLAGLPRRLEPEAPGGDIPDCLKSRRRGR